MSRWNVIVQPDNDTTLVCTACRRERPYDAFYRAKNGVSEGRGYRGFRMPCIECRLRAQKTPRARALEKKRRATPRYRIKSALAQKARTPRRSPEQVASERERKRAAYLANRDERLAKGRAAYADPSSGRKAQVQAAVQRRRATVEGAAAHRASNNRAKSTPRGRERSAHNTALRRARLAQVLCTLTLGEWRAIKAHYGHRCAYCERKVDRLEKDHVVPIAKGGPHAASNIVPACRSCNGKKWMHPAPKAFETHPFR